MRFQSDADFNCKLVAGIRRREPKLDILAAHESDLTRLPDPEVLSLAARLGRVLVSHDRSTMLACFFDFIQRQSSPGLILVPQDLGIGSAIEQLILIWECVDSVEMANSRLFLPL
ncbi:MAG TPA: DUF5615 family PIN-like protein [Bryobacteraceae bacterium]|nr:DUF5615 family PIN-like protein [Bryobacteraceae bacterium]